MAAAVPSGPCARARRSSVTCPAGQTTSRSLSIGCLSSYAHMKILVTGCCGFIGYHLILKLLVSNKINIFGIDNMNAYYDTQLKLDRLKILKVNIESYFFLRLGVFHYRYRKDWHF